MPRRTTVMLSMLGEVGVGRAPALWADGDTNGDTPDADQLFEQRLRERQALAVPTPVAADEAHRRAEHEGAHDAATNDVADDFGLVPCRRRCRSWLRWRHW